MDATEMFVKWPHYHPSIPQLPTHCKLCSYSHLYRPISLTTPSATLFTAVCTFFYHCLTQRIRASVHLTSPSVVYVWMLLGAPSVHNCPSHNMLIAIRTASRDGRSLSVYSKWQRTMLWRRMDQNLVVGLHQVKWGFTTTRQWGRRLLYLHRCHRHVETNY